MASRSCPPILVLACASLACLRLAGGEPQVPPADRKTPKTVLEGSIEKTVRIDRSGSPVLLRGTVTVSAQGVLALGPGVEVLPPEAGAAPVLLRVQGAFSIEANGAAPVAWDAGGSSAAAPPARVQVERGGRIAWEGLAASRLHVESEGEVRIVQSGFDRGTSIRVSRGLCMLTHCTFRGCAPVTLGDALGRSVYGAFIRRCIFEDEAGAVDIRGDPGPGLLIVDTNNFRRCSVYCLRAAAPVGSRDTVEFLLGENFYGSDRPEVQDAGLLDGRRVPSLRSRLNVRQPADEPYPRAGCGAAPDDIAKTAEEQDARYNRMLKALRKALAEEDAARKPAQGKGGSAKK